VGRGRRGELNRLVEPLCAELDSAHQAREVALAACRRVIRASGQAIRAAHRGDAELAGQHRSEAEEALRKAQDALGPFPQVAHAGFLHDAEKEYVEAVLTAAFVNGTPLAGRNELHVGAAAWLCGLAEGASELRRDLLDRIREGDLERGQELLGTMEEIYELLMGVDYPDALTGGLRRTTDALRAVLERSRADVATTVVQSRLQASLDRRWGEESG
jgi:translin